MMLLVSQMVLNIICAASMVWSVRFRRVEPFLESRIFSSLKFAAKSWMVIGWLGFFLQYGWFLGRAKYTSSLRRMSTWSGEKGGIVLRAMIPQSMFSSNSILVRAGTLVSDISMVTSGNCCLKGGISSVSIVRANWEVTPMVICPRLSIFWMLRYKLSFMWSTFLAAST